MLKVLALLTLNTLNINIGILKAILECQHFCPSGCAGAKGKMVNIWAKPDTTGDSTGRRHNIAGKSNRKWDVLSIENRKDLQGRTTTKQRREGKYVYSIT